MLSVKPIGSRNSPRIPTIPSLAGSASRFVARQQRHRTPLRVEREQYPDLASAGRRRSKLFHVLERRTFHRVHKRPSQSWAHIAKLVQRHRHTDDRLLILLLKPWSYQAQVNFPVPHNIPHTLFYVQQPSSFNDSDAISRADGRDLARIPPESSAFPTPLQRGFHARHLRIQRGLHAVHRQIQRSFYAIQKSRRPCNTKTPPVHLRDAQGAQVKLTT